MREAEKMESNTHIQRNLAGVSRLSVLHRAWFEAVVSEYSSDCWREQCAMPVPLEKWDSQGFLDRQLRTGR